MMHGHWDGLRVTWLPEGVEVHGNCAFGKDVRLCGPADFNGNDCSLVVGDGCDIAAFVTVNCADSHMRCIGLAAEIERLPIVIGDHVFIGQGATILGGCVIGHHSVIGAGVVLKGANIPPWSRVWQGGMVVQRGYYDRPVAPKGPLR